MHLYFSSLYFIVIRENRMSSKFVACIGKGGQRDMAESFARRTKHHTFRQTGRGTDGSF